MHVLSRSLQLNPGLPMGGYLGSRLSACGSDELEVNAWRFEDAATGRQHELCAIDALYAGDLVDALPKLDGARLIAASHTHTAPMLDSSKPMLGASAPEAIRQYAHALLGANRMPVRPNVCRIHRAAVPVPVYRRFDVPDSAVNRWLSARAGLYPNERLPIDRQIYLFEFARDEETQFTLAYHACHPVTRSDVTRLSADYVGSVRAAVRQRFGMAACLFMQGCAGDVRPNFARKRVNWLPRSRLNWRFEWPVPAAHEANADAAYAAAVQQATLWQTLPLGAAPVRVESRAIELRSLGSISITCIVIGERLRLEFVPFEVSHHFHLGAQKLDPLRFIVSCVNRTLGYLPHPSQLAAGGYEVDSSRACMGLSQRVELRSGAAW